MGCLIYERIKLIDRGENPCFVTELETGHVVLGDHQSFKGYTLFLCKRHAFELHELERDFKLKFLEEMALASEAVYRAFSAEKMNCELLGNGHAHLHRHRFSIRKVDMLIEGPVWGRAPARPSTIIPPSTAPSDKSA